MKPDKRLQDLKGTIRGWAFAPDDWLPGMLKRAEEVISKLPPELLIQAEELISGLREAANRKQEK